MRKTRSAAWGFLGAGLLATGLSTVAVPAATAAVDDVELASVGTGSPGTNAPEGARFMATSGDGRFVAFTTGGNLIGSDAANTDTYLRDRTNDSTVLVSRTNEGGFQNRNSSEWPAVSDNGRIVAFTSNADNLPDSQGRDDVYVRDLDAGTTELVSRASGAAGANGNSGSYVWDMSADGRYVVFSSTAATLHPGDTDFFDDVFVRDRELDTTTLVSRATGAAGAKGNGSSRAANITADGRYVAFESTSCNFDAADPPVDCGSSSGQDIYVRDLVANTTTLASRTDGTTGAAGNDGDGEWGRPSISDDGRYVAFGSESSNLLTPNGGGIRAIVRDMVDNVNIIASRADGADGEWANNTARDPFISRDGTRVSFTTQANNLDPADTDAGWDVYVRDLTTHETTLVSRAAGADGAKATSPGHLLQPLSVLSSDGAFVAFSHGADGLVAGDNDGGEDVVVRELSIVVPPADPTDITLSNDTLDENLPSGTTVGTLGVADVNAGETFTFSLVDGEGSGGNGAFTIDGATLKTTGPVDYESHAVKYIRIRVTDSTDRSYEEAFVVNFSNVNEKPTSSQLRPNKIAEGSPAGTLVGAFATADPDAGSSHTYALVPNANLARSAHNGQFTIDGNQLRTDEPLDYDDGAERFVTVRITDNGGLSIDRAFRVFVTDVEEQYLFVTDVETDEGTGTGFKNFDFNVTRTNTSQIETYTLRLVAGTASIPGDVAPLTASKSTITFNRGVGLKTVAIKVRRDGREENNETFRLEVLNSGGEVVAWGDGTIQDDD